MKIARIFEPLESSFSTPEAARKFLYLFALVVALTVYGGAYSYLKARFNDEVSLRRGHMNAAIYHMQSFFVSRQMLLKSLVMSSASGMTTPEVALKKNILNENKVGPGKYVRGWSLELTTRMIEYLRAKKVNLLYVNYNDEPYFKWLFTVGRPSERVPLHILQRLKSEEAAALAAGEELWLTDHINSPLYIFTRIDELSPNSGWLGLQVLSPDLISASEHEKAGDFMLIDAEGHAIFSSKGYELEAYAVNQSSESAIFGWEGGGWLPERLVIRKQLGYSRWQIVYSLELKSLLASITQSFFYCLMLCVLVTGLMAYIVRRVDQRLIVPAVNRINALMESETFSSAVIEIAPVALCVLRRCDGEVVLENALSQLWLGSGQKRERFSRDWITYAFNGVDNENTDEFEGVDGRNLYLSFTPTRYHGEDVLICAFSDISARKQVELALEKARISADEANDAKTMFLATMSHEIRTPLYGVLGTLELLARTELSLQQKNYLKAIEGSSGNLLQMICDVLDVSKIEAGQLSPELSIFSPVQLVQEVIQGYSGAAQSKGLYLFSFIDAQLPYLVRGDATRIRQILNNLLNNAVKFTVRGRIVIRARLESRDHERAILQWQVIDTGRGISVEDQKYLFDPFFQAGGNTNVVAGTGLGLSICKRLMHLMNGRLGVVSEPELGSSFTLSLPLEHIEPDLTDTWALPLLGESVYVVSPVLELSESFVGWLRRWGAKASVGVPKNYDCKATAVLVELHPGLADSSLLPDWQGPRVVASANGLTCLKSELCWHIDLNSLEALNSAVRAAQGHQNDGFQVFGEPATAFSLDLCVLVAEDNAINQLILRDQLEELGCTVVTACDGLEALSLSLEMRFDVVLTDVNMPKMNGYELAEQLRLRGCSAPIIGATANALLGEQERCLAAGMDHCLIKPFTLRALYQCLHHYERNVF